MTLRPSLFVPLVPLALALVACLADQRPSLHDVVVYDAGAVRTSYLYGVPAGLAIDGEAVRLERPETDAEAAGLLPGGLLVDGEPSLRGEIEPFGAAPTAVRRIPLTTDLLLETERAVGRIVYYDGQAYFELLPFADPGLRSRIVPRPRIGRLRGIGELTVPEADALADRLEQGGPFVLTELEGDDVPRRSIDGLNEYLATAVFVQRRLPTDTSAVADPGELLSWEVVARGSQAVGPGGQRFELVSDAIELAALWNRAHGGQLQIPPLPDADFARETLVFAFLEERPTGGYGAEVLEVTLEDGDIFVELDLTEPADGAIVTQAITRPWLLLRVLRGGVDVVWFRVPDGGDLIGVARRTE